VPSSTTSIPGHLTPSAHATQTHARALRVLLESLDDILRARSQLVQRAERLAEADDIGPRILKVAAGFEKWIDVKPVMFDDVSDEELVKYDKFIQGIEEGRGKQDELLEEIKVWSIVLCLVLNTKVAGLRLAINHFCCRGRKIHQSKTESMRCNPLIWLTTSTEKSRGTWMRD